VIAVSVLISSEDETVRLGETFGRQAAQGDVLALAGELGAGKTRFVKGLAKGMGIDPEDVTSPTFTLMNIYPGRPSLVHIDFYRLASARESESTGIEEYWGGDSVCVVEWADRLPDIVPERAAWLRFIVTGPEARRIEISFPDDKGKTILDALDGFDVV